ncbi:MAG: phosphate starvation-inducible protein PhoH [Elusimicrobia bacterium CG1_02_63_36]|nr:MAG: phosphate starvation-inducible protein PhoH [Elusimicrobia bacterium CG1_02_63_36]PIP83093.1 MAG: phosphate starvation-inducible protein PhoH [Elusimicrobia bacterium CG22_combo_CG10-13_8_21_14_all_63_91]PJA17348.1 MAG: phosphate starvation-inducible protein PhoH [Elusimicrobia bacterium CG_4_10_14_0_2_um_filter_63_34]PJB23647.1 MAG: phosphate starvation-inducible protein PhoH [Elusimicrobia bacterium CG_4_9_14_3_um_filter_62_55]
MKTFVLDTNVIIHDPDAMFAFEGSEVVLPLPVIEELDSFKRNNDERGRNARMVARALDGLREQGKLSDGVTLEHGGTFKVEMARQNGLPTPFDLNKKDNQILHIAQYVKEQNPKTIFISKDINLRIKAEAVGLETQDYEKSKVNVSELYEGWRELSVTKDDVNAFYKAKKLVPEESFLPNEFAILRASDDESSSALARYDGIQKCLVPLLKAEVHPWGVKPLNTEQKFALELLLRPEIQLVTLVGLPGCGKTLISLATGLEQTMGGAENPYRRLLVARPIVPVGNDIGYLPGSKQEKLNTWMGAIYDNLEFLLDRPRREETNIDIQMMLDDGRLEVEAVAYLRGRTLPGQYILIDDAQNLTPHEVKTIISRCGLGSKIVLTGDPYQIDNYYLDSSSNGLTNLVQKFKGQNLFGHIWFSKVERSPIAALASELL